MSDEKRRYYVSVFQTNWGKSAVFTARNDNLQLAKDHAEYVAKVSTHLSPDGWSCVYTRYLGVNEPTHCGEIIEL